MAENNTFEQRCKCEIDKIKKQIQVKNRCLTDEQINKINKLIQDDKIIDEYIKFISDYAQKIKQGENYKNDVLKFIDSSHIDYKKTKNDTKKVMENFKKIVETVTTDTNEITEFMRMFELSISKYKQKLQKVKKDIMKKGVARIETLEHNLLYCKGNDVKKSNKIGFLNYLYYVVLPREDIEKEEKKIRSKLRFPFDTSIYYTGFDREIEKNVKTLREKLNELMENPGPRQSNLIGTEKFYEKAKKVEKNIYLSLAKNKGWSLTKGQTDKILKKSFGDKFAANAYGELEDDVIDIISAGAIVKLINENTSKVINGNPDKLIKEGAYGVLINSIDLFCCIAMPAIKLIHSTGRSVYKLACSLGKLIRGTYKKIEGTNKSKN